MSRDAPSLRERKKQRTRRQIEMATFALVVEQGWAATTIPEIAEAADVSPRTVSAYFPNKMDIVFSGTSERLVRIKEYLEDLDVSIVEGMRRWLRVAIETTESEPSALRTRAINADPELAAHDRVLFAEFERIVAQATSDRTGQPVEATGPRMVGACAVAACMRFRDWGLRDDRSGFEQIAAEAFDLLSGVYRLVADL